MNALEDALKAFMAANPDLPAGEEAVETAQPTDAPAKQTLEVLMERKGRGGKTATIIAGFTLPDDEVAAIASALKSRLGTGGSARGGEILIQGDRRTEVAAWLRERGHRVKGVK